MAAEHSTEQSARLPRQTNRARDKEPKSKGNYEREQTEHHRTEAVLAEVVHINLYTGLEHDIQHAHLS